MFLKDRSRTVSWLSVKAITEPYPTYGNYRTNPTEPTEIDGQLRLSIPDFSADSDSHHVVINIIAVIIIIIIIINLLLLLSILLALHFLSQ